MFGKAKYKIVATDYLNSKDTPRVKLYIKKWFLWRKIDSGFPNGHFVSSAEAIEYVNKLIKSNASLYLDKQGKAL